MKRRLYLLIMVAFSIWSAGCVSKRFTNAPVSIGHSADKISYNSFVHTIEWNGWRVSWTDEFELARNSPTDLFFKPRSISNVWVTVSSLDDFLEMIEDAALKGDVDGVSGQSVLQYLDKLGSNEFSRMLGVLQAGSEGSSLQTRASRVVHKIMMSFFFGRQLVPHSIYFRSQPRACIVFDRSLCEGNLKEFYYFDSSCNNRIRMVLSDKGRIIGLREGLKMLDQINFQRKSTPRHSSFQ